MALYNYFLSAILLAFVCHRIDSQSLSQSFSRACEGNNLFLSCSSGTLLNICYANYGRLLPGLLACPRFGRDLFILCFSTNATTTMRSRCNDRSNCTVPASNSVFGNPCPGTYKYLATRYQCIPYQRACEGNTLNINCPGSQRISVVNATYGRTIPGTEVCQYSNPSATTNIDCRSANSTTVAATTCNGQNSCSIPATSSTFGGDPCPGTYKYLQVSYICA